MHQFEHITKSKVSKYRIISSPYFPVFRLNTEIYSVNVHIQSKYKKIQAINNFAFKHFSRSVFSIFLRIVHIYQINVCSHLLNKCVKENHFFYFFFLNFSLLVIVEYYFPKKCVHKMLEHRNCYSA